jgi:Icc-related predicted phosphoesterase
MFIGALGDIHGDFDSVRQIMAAEPAVHVWISVGDLADAEGRYEAVPAPLYFIKGNNENFETLAAGALPGNLHYLPNAVVAELAGLRVCGLGGTLAPSVYDLPPDRLPHPRKRTARATELADRRRHFVRDEVARCAALADVGIFMSHEAPRPFLVGRVDAGKTPVNEVLAAMQPRLHLFGHHHRFSEQLRQGVRSVGLDLVSRSYLLIDPETLEYDVKLR